MSTTCSPQTWSWPHCPPSSVLSFQCKGREVQSWVTVTRQGRDKILSWKFQILELVHSQGKKEREIPDSRDWQNEVNKRSVESAREGECVIDWALLCSRCLTWLYHLSLPEAQWSKSVSWYHFPDEKTEAQRVHLPKGPGFVGLPARCSKACVSFLKGSNKKKSCPNYPIELWYFNAKEVLEAIISLSIDSFPR